jgi:hypothetical protein
MTNPEQVKSTDPAEYAVLVKKAANHLAKIAKRLDEQESLITPEVQWLLDTSARDITVAYTHSLEKPSNNLVDAPSDNWDEFDVASAE